MAAVCWTLRRSGLQNMILLLVLNDPDLSRESDFIKPQELLRFVERKKRDAAGRQICHWVSWGGGRKEGKEGKKNRWKGRKKEGKEGKKKEIK